MKKTGQIVLFRFPQTDLVEGKLRPALILGKLPGEYDDWPVTSRCGSAPSSRHISRNLKHAPTGPRDGGMKTVLR